LRVSPKAWATVENVRLPVDDNCGGNSLVMRVARRRPTADDDDLGYIGCRVIPPIRIAERRPFGAAGCRFERVVGNASIKLACLFIVRLRSAAVAAISGRFTREIESFSLITHCTFAKIFYADCGGETTRAESPARSCRRWVNQRHAEPSGRRLLFRQSATSAKDWRHIARVSSIG
jgi:hypothetical protein